DLETNMTNITDSRRFSFFVMYTIVVQMLGRRLIICSFEHLSVPYKAIWAVSFLASCPILRLVCLLGGLHICLRQSQSHSFCPIPKDSVQPFFLLRNSKKPV